MTLEKHIKNLGQKRGKLLFFGGVYSNLQSLQALKKWADENNCLPENIFCTGDTPGYCAQPVECLQLIKEWDINTIAGNVELQVRNDKEDCGCDFESGGRCDLFSKSWYAYVRSKMNTEQRAWLNMLPDHIQFEYCGKNIFIVHGSYFNVSEFIFQSTPWALKQKNFEVASADIIIAGHCGLPFAHAKNERLWLNPGVTGMPANDGTDRVWFATLEGAGEKTRYQFHSYTYDHKSAAELMLENGLPATYANTLSTGIWDNCEVLPETETNLQGKKILL